MSSEAGPVVALTGDVMPQTSLARSALSPETARAYDLLRDADVAFANLECPLTVRGFPADKLVTLRAEPGLAQELQAIGIDIVTVANNHALDFGVDGLFDTMDALDSAGLPYVGLGRDLESALACRVVTVKGLRLGFMGVASTLAPNSAASEQRPGAAPIRVFTSYVADTVTTEENPGIAPYVKTSALESDVATVEQAVGAAKQQVDYLLLGLHWGVPNGWVGQFQDVLAEYQQPLAHRLVDAGVDVVVGHHPHVLHGVEWYRRRPILYSLGNYLFHRLIVGQQPKLQRSYPPYDWSSLRSADNLDSVVARITLSATGGVDLDIVPVVLDAKGEPQAASGDDGLRIRDRIAAFSERFGTTVEATESGMRLAGR